MIGRSAGNLLARPPFTAPTLKSYQTTFPSTENPISESGSWNSNGSNWSAVRSSGGIAFGTQTSGSGTFDDSNSYLSGTWSADQECSATLSKASPSGFQEVECLLRWTTNGSNSTTGYECLIAHDGAYLQVVKWNGPLASFVYLVDLRADLPTPASGGILRARIVGDVISVFYKPPGGSETQYVTKNVNTDKDGNSIGKWTSGAPGIGFFRESGSGAADQFAATAFSATEV